MINFKDYLKEALSPKQKKIAKLAGDEDKIDAADLKALRNGAKIDECDMEKEELVGKQYKLDKNKNGKIDAQDLKIVRGEKAEESFKPEIADKFPAPGVKTHEPKEKYSTMPKDREKAKGMPANKMSEETELDEGRMKDLAYDLDNMKDAEFHKTYGNPKHHYDPSRFKKPVQPGHEMERARALAQRGMMSIKEEAEIIAEISKKTLGSYVNRAANQAIVKSLSNPADKSDDMKTIDKREKGIRLATSKLAKEETEQIDELSKKTLGSYVNKAAHDSRMQGQVATDFENMADRARKQSKADSYERLHRKYLGHAWKREAGIAKAVGKLTKEAKDGWSEKDSLAKPISSNQAMAQHAHYFSKVTKLDPKTGEPMKKKDVKEEVAQEMSPYVKGTLAVMDEGKVDDLRDAQKLRQDTMSAYDKDYKPDTSHPHIEVVKGSAYGGANQKDDENDEKPDETKEKRGRGRPAGSKSGARV